MTNFQPTINQAIERRRCDMETEWNGFDAVVPIGAGDPIPIPGRADHVYPFLAHSEYFYLTDHNRPGAVLVYDPHEGWIEFVPMASADDLLWSGDISDEAGRPISELGPWLVRRRERTVRPLPPSGMKNVWYDCVFDRGRALAEVPHGD
jgi:hypothetical protein